MAWRQDKEPHQWRKLPKSVSTRIDREAEQLCSSQAWMRALMRLYRRAHLASAESTNGSVASPIRPASAWPADSGQGLVTRYDIKEFLVNRLLAYAMQLEIQVFQNPVNVLLCPLNRGNAAGTFAGKRLGARLKQQDKQVFGYECAQRRLGSLDDFRREFGWPRTSCKLFLPRQIQRRQALADRFVDGS